METKEFLSPTRYIDSDSSEIIDAAGICTAGLSTDKEKAIAIFYSVRDRIKYNPYMFSLDKTAFIASGILKRSEGFCIQKAILYAAMARAVNIPCNLGFANVKNHLTTTRLRELLGSDIFVFHGYNSILIEDKWIKATPTFDIKLCEKFGVKPLDFDGLKDAIFHEYDKAGRKHMEYLHDYGTFGDLPYDLMISEMVKHYPELSKIFISGKMNISGDFINEVKVL
jgi:transglutaminase-like putative cysteine protease